MKKIIIASIIVLICCVKYSATAQTNSIETHQPTYQELKEAGLLNNYTPEQLTQMQLKELHDRPSPNNDEPSTRNNDPDLPAIQTTSNAFSITPGNPSIC